MEWTESKRFLLIGASALLVVVCLLAFGERVYHGHYHLDGGRGWDLPSAGALDAGHTQLASPVSPTAFFLFNQNEATPPIPVKPLEVGLPEALTSIVWFRLRPPPSA